ncbi:MAG: thiolase family protein [Candidatus Dadabacteria bacterium]|nr:MAG: thiolase family protein [Candidatus Dadabacteria bacterium]
MSTKKIFICEPLRTAIGSFGGALKDTPATDLGAAVTREVVSRTGVPLESIDQIIFGCVLAAGLGQAPARQVGIKAGLPVDVQAMTINKVCSSGLKAVLLAANTIRLGLADAIVAGGMENMSRAPYLLPALRSGARLGDTRAQDSLIVDALWDVYNNFHMGNAAELCARECNISREAQDQYAIESYRRAQAAIEQGIFKDEIVPVQIKQKKETLNFEIDEEPAKARPDKIPQLRPVFEKDGTVTAANASSINDGASAMLVCSEDYVNAHGLTPIAEIVEEGWKSQKPEWFTTAPVGAVEKLLERSGLKLSDIDLFEINEAFSAVALACSSKLGIDSDRLNIYGGAVALGHPVGASGARILTTLAHALKRNSLKRGVAAICNGGGEATAVLIEAV